MRKRRQTLIAPNLEVNSPPSVSAVLGHLQNLCVILTELREDEVDLTPNEIEQHEAAQDMLRRLGKGELHA